MASLSMPLTSAQASKPGFLNVFFFSLPHLFVCQLAGICSFLPLCGFQKLHSGCQGWWQVNHLATWPPSPGLLTHMLWLKRAVGITDLDLFDQGSLLLHLSTSNPGHLIKPAGQVAQCLALGHRESSASLIPRCLCLSDVSIIISPPRLLPKTLSNPSVLQVFDSMHMAGLNRSPPCNEGVRGSKCIKTCLCRVASASGIFP